MTPPVPYQKPIAYVTIILTKVSENPLNSFYSFGPPANDQMRCRVDQPAQCQKGLNNHFRSGSEGSEGNLQVP